jgi:tRNA(Arg) A34 adenosine deaminase TadA
MNWRPLSSKELQAAEHYVRLAMAQAELAAQTGNAPFGAIIVDALGEVVASEHNRVREALDPSAHAEINAIRLACRRMRMPTLEGYGSMSTRNRVQCASCVRSKPSCLRCTMATQMTEAPRSLCPLPRSCVVPPWTTECWSTAASWLRRLVIIVRICYAGILPDPQVAGAVACLHSSDFREHRYGEVQHSPGPADEETGPRLAKLGGACCKEVGSAPQILSRNTDGTALSFTPRLPKSAKESP